MPCFKIYHNPRCSKSRQTLELLQQNGAEVEIIEYLKTPPSETQLKFLLKALALKPDDLMRRKEAEFSQCGLDQPGLSDAQKIALMVANPKVIERPIVVREESAVIGRPPENVLKLF